jgi:hypothetical protein
LFHSPAEQRDDVADTAPAATEINRDDDVSSPSTQSLVAEESKRIGGTGNKRTLGYTSTFDSLDDALEQRIRIFKKMTLSDMLQLLMYTYADNLFDALEGKDRASERKRHLSSQHVVNDDARQSGPSNGSKHERVHGSMEEDSFLSDDTDATDGKDRESALYSIGKSFVEKTLECLPEMCTGTTGAPPIESKTEEQESDLAEPKVNPSASCADDVSSVSHDLDRKTSILKKVLPALRMRTSNAHSVQTKRDDPPVRFVDIANVDPKKVDTPLDGNRSRSLFEKVRPRFSVRKAFEISKSKSDLPVSHVYDSNVDSEDVLETSVDDIKDKTEDADLEDVLETSVDGIKDKMDQSVHHKNEDLEDTLETSVDDIKDKTDLSINHKDTGFEVELETSVEDIKDKTGLSVHHKDALSEPEEGPSVVCVADSGSVFDGVLETSVDDDKDKTDCSANHEDS